MRLVAVGLASAVGQLHAQSLAPPEDLTQWDLHCFCINAVRTPHRIIKMDDNGRLLFLAREGISIAALRQRGTRVTDSQINLLETFNMLRREGDVVTTAIPVLGPAQMAPLRK
ncbi:hypothetical protein GCM10011273_34630 [Asticcacaulis endophyticus]|uniref:Uncharacterized protein n=1 Tax=Asticcacaulis endophyticus TaxID=1395890 RepID=A0A918QHL6_9CAUL|nr:hypothetical protein GCM10011273_34630 [Asticcacaulis endophyticus]